MRYCLQPRFFSACVLVFLLLGQYFLVPSTSATSVEQSLTESLTRGGRFTATLTGMPNTSYYIWLPRTFSMSGEPGNQPPTIADYLLNVKKDPAGGPYPIGSYEYNNGNGRTIRDDIPPSTAAMPNTNYYALVTTDNSGQAVVEFQTSVNTGLRSYSVRVENPGSVDKDNLQVTIQVFSRIVPPMTTITRVPAMEPVAVPSSPATTATRTLPAETPQPIVSAPEPIRTPATTPETPAGLFPLICGILVAALWIRKR